jgi:hypothetical protein
LLDSFFTTVPMPQRQALLGQIMHHMTDQVVLPHGAVIRGR